MVNELSAINGLLKSHGCYKATTIVCREPQCKQLCFCVLLNVNEYVSFSHDWTRKLKRLPESYVFGCNHKPRRDRLPSRLCGNNVCYFYMIRGF
jgi:hypothetical protein